MCGIVGYVGFREAYPVLVKGLHRLEYRGYDSAGVALLDADGELNVYKTRGKVADLERFAASKNLSGTIGIAHTRWATHGQPNDVNAHPHCSQSKRLALIHNGIIENYALLKEVLIAHGYTFQSTTDTEVLVQLVEYMQDENRCSLLDAVRLALRKVEGAYAIAVVERGNPDTIVAARKGSPLVVGLAEGECFLASDATPIAEYTQRVVYLNDCEVVEIVRGREMKVVGLDNNECPYNVDRLEMSINQLEKGGYEHFMLKEIMEQPSVLTTCLSGRVVDQGKRVVLSGVVENSERFLAARRIIIVACGTSWHAALIGEHLLEDFARIPVEVEYASEFRYRNPVIGPDDVVIALSQSGETADTLAAVQLARSCGAFIYGICNVVGSSIARATDSGTYIHVGPEIGVASTKAFTGQVTVLTMLALCLGRMKGTIDQQQHDLVARGLLALPDMIGEVLKLNDRIRELSKIFTYAHNFIYLGRGYNYPVAMEGALKLKEISYIHAEGYPAAEMKHGAIALIDNEMPVVAIATADSVYDKTVSNIQEIKARGGRVIAFVSEGDRTVEQMADYTIVIPHAVQCLSAVLVNVPLQLLAYYIAVNKGRDVDQPRNLAKSVTVE